MSQSKRSATIQIQADLVSRWPDLFSLQAPVPLAIGIRESLMQAMPDAMRPALANALCQWCSRPAYLMTLKSGAARHDLDGAVVGEVSEEAATVAAERLQSLKDQAKVREEAKQRAEQEEKARAAAAKAQKKPAKPPKPAPSVNPEPPPAKPAAPVIVVKKRRGL